MLNRLKEQLNWAMFRERALVPASARARSARDWVVENDPVYRSFRRPGLAEKWAASITLLLIAAVVIFLLLFDWNWLRGPIGRWASVKYDREIALNGDLDVHLFSWTPSVVVRGLKVGGPDWAREKDTADVGRIDASVRLRNLFAGQIVMPNLAITGAEVALIATEDGKKSWALNPHAPDTGEGMKLPAIQRLTITDGHVTIDERKRGMTLDAKVTAQETAGDDHQAGFTLDGSGRMNGTPLTLKIEGGPFINIRRDRPYHFVADLKGVGSHLTADGSVTRPFDLGQFQAKLSLEGQDLADLYVLIGVTTPNTPPYRLSGDLSRDDALFKFSDFSGRVGSSDLSGDLKVDKVGDRRVVTADLRSRLLDIDDLAAVLGAKPTVTGSGDTVASSGSPGRLLPDAPLKVERLRAMDGTLSYRAASVKSNAFEIRRVNLGADLKAGILKLDPVSFAFNRGELNGTARIDATKDMPYTTADFRLAGYPLESIIPARNGAPTVTGRALGRAKLEGAGASVHDMAAHSKGSISLVVPQGEIRAAFAELLGINVGAGLRKLLSGDTSTTPIRCAVADFSVVNGTATAKTLVIDTGVVLAQGSGTIDLGAETLNLKINGDTKKARLLRVWAPILINGPLVAPHLGVDAAAVVAQGGLAGAIGALVSPIGALLAFVDPGLAKDADCGALIGSAR